MIDVMVAIKATLTAVDAIIAFLVCFAAVKMKKNHFLYFGVALWIVANILLMWS